MIQIFTGLNACCKQPTGIRAEGGNKGVVGDKARRTSEADWEGPRMTAPRRMDLNC